MVKTRVLVFFKQANDAIEVERPISINCRIKNFAARYGCQYSQGTSVTAGFPNPGRNMFGKQAMLLNVRDA